MQKAHSDWNSAIREIKSATAKPYCAGCVDDTDKLMADILRDMTVAEKDNMVTVAMNEIFSAVKYGKTIRWGITAVGRQAIMLLPPKGKFRIIHMDQDGCWDRLRSSEIEMNENL